jgi:hypothetical protein
VRLIPILVLIEVLCEADWKLVFLGWRTMAKWPGSFMR